jgi:hypothetical protein
VAFALDALDPDPDPSREAYMYMMMGIQRTSAFAEYG